MGVVDSLGLRMLWEKLGSQGLRFIASYKRAYFRLRSRLGDVSQSGHIPVLRAGCGTFKSSLGKRNNPFR